MIRGESVEHFCVRTTDSSHAGPACRQALHGPALTCLPEGNKTHDRSGHSFPKERIDDWMEPGSMVEVDIAQAALEIH